MDQRLKSGDDFESEIMLRDVWKWIKGDEPSYTFQSAQYRSIVGL